MGMSLGAYLSVNVLYPIPGDPEVTAERGDGGEQGEEHWSNW